jgi:uncharacterized protein
MLFVITAFDRPARSSGACRSGPHTRDLKGEAARIKVGGPLLNDNEQPIGSLLIIEADHRNAAEAFADADPYRKAVRARRFGPGEQRSARGQADGRG